MRSIDIAVAGCGPAGLAAALLLHRDGHRVTLFERFATPQPIGSGLMVQPTGLAVLRQLGLDREILERGARVDRLFGMADGRTVLDVGYAALTSHTGDRAFGIGIHRASLFDVLHGAVSAGDIPIETSRQVSGSEGGALLFADGSRSARFDLIVDALGTATPLAPPTGRQLSYGALWATLDWPGDAGFDGHALEQRYVRASVMAGVLPIGVGKTAFFWSLRGCDFDAWCAAGIDSWKDRVRSVWPATEPLLDQIGTPEALTFARYTHRTLRDPAGPGLVHIGDAWHSASPQLGQGANMALLDAYALAKALRDCLDLAPALARYTALRRRHVWLYQAMSALFTPVYQSDSRVLPFVRDRLVGPLSKFWPATRLQAAMVAGLVGNPLGVLGLK